MRKHENTACHEAGHVVATVVLQLRIGRRGVTIIPKKADGTLGTLGAAHILQQLRENPEYGRSAGMHLRLEKHAIACLAGDAAERRANSRRRFGGHQDIRHAAALLANISTSFEQHDARIEVARLGARDLVKTNWPAIKAVAEELLHKKKLSSPEVKKIVLRCDEEYYAAIDRSLGLV